MGAGVCSKSEKLDENDYLVGSADEFNFEKNPDFFKKVEIKDGFSVIVWQLGVGKYFAVSSKCPHYDADLSEGVMRKGRIYCPWHGACFDLFSGDMEDFPGLDAISQYSCKLVPQKVKKAVKHVIDGKEVKREIEGKGGLIYVHVEPDEMNYKITRPLAFEQDSDMIFAILGAGPAGYTCAQTLRQEGFNGKLIMITADKYLPYDRTKLSKSPAAELEWEKVKLRGQPFYDEADIEILTNTKIRELDLRERKVYIEDRVRAIEYHSVCICMGRIPRTYSARVPGHDLKNILTLHNLESAQHIVKEAAGKRIAIIGSSFLAMELASALRDVCPKIDIISKSVAPYQAVLGLAVGGGILKHVLASSHNISFHMLDEIVTFIGAGGSIAGITTARGKKIACELAIVAIGTYIDLSYINQFPSMPVCVNEKTKTIDVDEFMRTNMIDTYAAGDCCNFPIDIGCRDIVSIGHWQVAQTTGRVAALNMLGQKISIKSLIPFFWTTVCGVTIKYCGYGESYDEIIVFGSLQTLEFCAIYRRDRRILAACGANVDPLITEISIELQTEPEWHEALEFPKCVTTRFPDPPIQVEKSRGKRMFQDPDLVRHFLDSVGKPELKSAMEQESYDFWRRHRTPSALLKRKKRITTAAWKTLPRMHVPRWVLEDHPSDALYKASVNRKLLRQVQTTLLPLVPAPFANVSEEEEEEEDLKDNDTLLAEQLSNALEKSNEQDYFQMVMAFLQKLSSSKRAELLPSLSDAEYKLMLTCYKKMPQTYGMYGSWYKNPWTIEMGDARVRGKQVDVALMYKCFRILDKGLISERKRLEDLKHPWFRVQSYWFDLSYRKIDWFNFERPNGRMKYPGRQGYWMRYQRRAVLPEHPPIRLKWSKDIKKLEV